MDVVQENLDALKSETGIPGPGRGRQQREERRGVLRDYAAENGAPDVLINNAGITADALFIKQKGDEITKFPFANWERVLNVNLTGVFLCAREAAFHMVKAQGQGRDRQYFVDQPRGEPRPDQLFSREIRR